MSDLNVLQLRAGANVASLLEVVDMVRLISVRDRLYPAFSASASKVPAQQGYREYLRFLTIKILSVDTSPLEYSPSVYIDQLWHAHILDTQAWLALTDKYPRERLIHDPCPPEGLHASRLNNTLSRYRELFDESPLRDSTYAIWNEPDLPSIPTPPRSVSPMSSTSITNIPLPLTASSWPSTHTRVLIYDHHNLDEDPEATLESHTNDTIASIIRKYQLKRNSASVSKRLSMSSFFLWTPGYSHPYMELPDTGKTLGTYLATRPSAVKQLAKAIEVRILVLVDRGC